jgi:hypothetical protein
MRVTTPAQLRQQRQHNKGNDASAMRQQQHKCNEDEEDAIATTTKTAQRCQHDEGEDASKAWATTMTPAQQRLAVAVGAVVIVIVVGLCLSSSPRLKRNYY